MAEATSINLSTSLPGVSPALAGITPRVLVIDPSESVRGMGPIYCTVTVKQKGRHFKLVFLGSDWTPDLMERTVHRYGNHH